MRCILCFRPSRSREPDNIMFCYLNTQELSEKFGKLTPAGVIPGSILRH
ncbi:hypothetical protein DDI_4007 [Dickeya dianthicola RNS04.9]|nr:hypothetical protein DDI_4007 [Dickeya dianthicola RNS04.9]